MHVSLRLRGVAFCLLLLVSCRSRHSELSGLGYSFSPQEPPKTAEELVQLFDGQYPRYFAPGYFDSMRMKLKKEIENYLPGSQVPLVTLSTLQQWLYLEAFKKNRLEFLLSSTLHALARSSLPVARARAIIEKRFPQNVFENYPDILSYRMCSLFGIDPTVAGTDPKAFTDKYSCGLPESGEKTWAELRPEWMESLRGSVEGAYLSLKFLEAREAFIRANLGGSSDFEAKISDIEMMRALIYSSYSVLSTEVFKSKVQPHYSAELQNAMDLSGKAINAYTEKFDKLIARQASLTELEELLVSPAILDMGEGIAKALVTKESQSFRTRIVQHIESAVAEVLNNLEIATREHLSQYQSYNVVPGIISTNVRTSDYNATYRRWLVDLLKENSIRTVLRADFPYLGSAESLLIDFAGKEITSQNVRMNLLTSALVVATTASASSAQKAFSWAGKDWPWRWIQKGIIALDGTVLATSGIVTIGKYFEYSRLSLLSRLSLEGRSLVSATEAEAAYGSYLTSAVWTGAIGLGTGVAWRRLSFPSDKLVTRKSLGARLIRHAVRTWQGDPMDATVLAQLRSNTWAPIKASLNQGLRSLKADDLRRFAESVLYTSAAYATQLTVSAATMMPRMIKVPAASLSVGTFKAITFGMSAGIFVAVCLRFFEAKGLRVLVDSVEAFGIDAPAFLEQGAVDPAVRAELDAKAVAAADAASTKMIVTNMAISIENFTRELASSEVSAQVKQSYRSFIESQRSVIRDALRRQLVSFYDFPYFRRIRAEEFKKLHFGFNAQPSLENPIYITLSLNVGKTRYAEQMTPDEAKQRVLENKEGFSQGEIEKMIQETTEKNPSAPGLPDASTNKP